MSAVKARHDLSLPEQSAGDQPIPSEAGALYLPEETKSIAELQSLSISSVLENTKSESQMEMETMARQKEIDRKLLLAEKVHV